MPSTSWSGTSSCGWSLRRSTHHGDERLSEGRPDALLHPPDGGDEAVVEPDALLAQPFNSSLGNVEWPTKQAKIEAVKGSQTPLTVEVLPIKTWNKTTIDNRSKALAKKAVRAATRSAIPGGRPP